MFESSLYDCGPCIELIGGLVCYSMREWFICTFTHSLSPAKWATSAAQPRDPLPKVHIFLSHYLIMMSGVSPLCVECLQMIYDIASEIDFRPTTGELYFSLSHATVWFDLRCLCVCQFYSFRCLLFYIHHSTFCWRCGL